MTRDKLINWLTRRTADESQLEAADMLQRDGKELERLRAELETERMRLVACSVIAIANTPESAASARGMHPDYQSPYCDDVARAVDREIALRAELAECKLISVARQAHIERLCRRNKLQCAANGCPGCAVCDPVAALAAKEKVK